MNLKSQVGEILSAFEQTWTFDLRDLNRPTSEEVLRALIQKCEVSHRKRLEQEFFACGPLSALLDDTFVTEVIVNGAEEIWYEREGAFLRLDDAFLSDLTFKNFVDRVCAEAAVKVDLEHPFADGRWAGFRLHIACAPLSHCAFHLSLRRMPDNPWTLTSLKNAGWCDEAQMLLLRDMVRERRNVVVIGQTGSGKTTVLGACMKELGPSERAVVIEDTDELHLPNSASTKLLTRPHIPPSLREVSLADLVRQSLRMRPHRLVIGEVRGAEAKDLLLALATGHSGSWGTLHAGDPRQALLRLEMLVQLGAPQWNLSAVRQLLHLSLDAIVVCEMKNGHRALGGVHKVAALETCGFLLEPMC